VQKICGIPSADPQPQRNILSGSIATLEKAPKSSAEDSQHVQKICGISSADPQPHWNLKAPLRILSIPRWKKLPKTLAY